MTRTVDRRIGEQHTQLPIFRQRLVDAADGAKEFRKDGRVPYRMLRRVLPRVTKFSGGHLLATNEAIHHLLISGAAEFDDDVVDVAREVGVTDQLEPERMRLFVAMTPFVERDDVA